MYDDSRSEGYASAIALMYAFIQLLIIGLLVLVSLPRDRKRV
jgi:hypothetical protein